MSLSDEEINEIEARCDDEGFMVDYFDALIAQAREANRLRAALAECIAIADAHGSYHPEEADRMDALRKLVTP